MDTKHLDDLTILLPAIQARQLPACEYTTRGVATGLAHSSTASNCLPTPYYCR